MISTRTPYAPAEFEFYRRTDRGVHMPLSQNSHIHDQYETGSHLSSRTTPTSEPDSRAPTGSRKRVPVACERCRKRKIKCSGNEGESQACANCRNSGNEADCRFLRVQSIETSHLGFRGYHGPHRYSPYPFPPYHHMNYVSRCAPQPTLQYHTIPSSSDYNPYSSQTSNVDWSRASYVGQVGHMAPYSPYPDDEESSPYNAQPPSFILPNTDPMSTNNAYLVHGHGGRPHPSSLWPEPQHYLSQPTSQLTSTAYTMTHSTPQTFQPNGTAVNLPSDRILPQPFTARGYIPTPASSIDIPVSTPSQRSHSYWQSDSNNSVQQLPTPVEATSSQDQALERENVAYRLQELTYGQANLDESLGVTSVSSSNYLAVNEPQPLAVSVSASAADAAPVVQQHSGLSMVLGVAESQKNSGADASGLSYNYQSSMNGHASQMRNASSQLAPGGLYVRTNMPSRQDLGSDDCSPDCTSCQTTESTRTSFTSISSVSGGGC